MKHFFVINLHSFNNQAQLSAVLDDITACFSDSKRIEHEIFLSRYSRAAIAAIDRYMSALSPHEVVRIYAVGGDGILYDCLNGMIVFPNAELTNVPYGSSNDFVLSFGKNAISEFRNIKSLIEGESRSVDVISCNSNYVFSF